MQLVKLCILSNWNEMFQKSRLTDQSVCSHVNWQSEVKNEHGEILVANFSVMVVRCWNSGRGGAVAEGVDGWGVGGAAEKPSVLQRPPEVQDQSKLWHH